MEPAKISEDAPMAASAPGQVVPMSLRDRVVDTGARDATPQRDWSAALNLVNECFEAVRIADARAITSEARVAELTQRLEDHVRTAELRLNAANKRADGAEIRARNAEEWLVKFHDTIVAGFQKTFTPE